MELMIIPAAGLGSRLGSSTPKVLFLANGRPLIDHLFDLYSRVIDRFILVLHPSFEQLVRRYCERYPFPIEYVIQETPTGMLDAILAPRELVRSHRPRSIWITWCDQIAVSAETISELAKRSAELPQPDLVFPTVITPKPYIHFVRDGALEIVAVLHRREGDALPDPGESDIGLFCLSSHAYLDLLPRFWSEAEAGSATNEKNFLPFIPWASSKATVRSFPARDNIEAVGVNTLADLRLVEKHLMKREGVAQ